jgi:hypothetical protein
MNELNPFEKDIKKSYHLPEATPAFFNNLEVKLQASQPNPEVRSKTTFRFSHGWAYALGGSLILLFTLLLAPPVRVNAWQGVINLGRIFFSHEPTYAERFEDRINNEALPSTDALDSTAVEWQELSLLSQMEATNQAGFQVYQINQMPGDFKMVVRNVTLPNEETLNTKVTTTYQSGEQMLVFSQTRSDPDVSPQVLPVGDAEISEVDVQNTTGTWISGLRLSTYVDEQNTLVAQYANVLAWEKDNFEFWLQSSPGLSLENMLEIADSIR